MKKVLVFLAFFMFIYTMKDWFGVGMSTICTVLCVDGTKVLICRDYRESSYGAPTPINIGKCKVKP